jgi:hypothetical protein
LNAKDQLRQSSFCKTLQQQAEKHIANSKDCNMEGHGGKARRPLASKSRYKSERQQVLTVNDHNRLNVMGAADLNFHIIVYTKEHTSFTATFSLPV